MARVRTTARVVPVTADGRVLVLLDRDPARPGVLRWGTVGGAVEDGESLPQAAVRELFEETGIRAEPADLTAAFHRGQREFSYGGVDYLGDSTFFALPLPRPVVTTFDHLEPDEVDNLLEARWMTPQELATDGRLVVPDLSDIVSAAVIAARGAVP